MDPGVIGRDEELAQVRAVIAGLGAGPQALVVEGEPGIGKTAVWLAALETAATAGCRVLRCAGEESEARLSFAGLTDLVGDTPEALLSTLPAPQREALEVALLLKPGGSGRGPEPRAVAMALRSLLVALARSAPVVVAVDDAQWVDAATMQALTFAARRLDGHPVGVVATVRTPHRSAAVLALERALAPTRVRLGPLSLGALGVALERRLGHRYRRPVLVRIEQVSGGNPLFALEIARSLGPAPTLEPGSALPVPVTLQEVVAERIAGLAPDGRQSLLVAAAVSHPTAELVERASSAAGLAVAEEAGLLRVDRGRVTFTHPLYAAAVYATAASGRRQATHAALAELIADPEERARHLALATGAPDDGVAATLDAGAAAARARGAWATAAELLEQARALTSGAQPGAARRRGVRAAELHMHAGDRVRARALLEEIAGEPPRDATRSDALRLLAEISYNEDHFAAAAELLEQARHGLDDRALAITIGLDLAHVLCHHLGDVARAQEHVDRALSDAKALGDPALEAEALAARATIDFIRARPVEWAMVERSLALEDPRRVLPLQRRPSMLAAQLALAVGELADARERLTRLRSALVDSGDESELALVDLWLAWLETLAGDLAAASDYADEAARHAALTESERDRCWALAQRALVQAHLGDLVAAREAADAAGALSARLGASEPLLWVTAAVAVLELSLGNAEAAWAAMAQVVVVVEAGGVGPVGFLPDALEALIGLGELDRAARLLDRFERRGRELDRAWVLAAAARCRGLLLAARGDLDAAQEALDEALTRQEPLGMRFALARTLLAAGQVRRRRREKRRSREALERAHELFEQMGARLWAERTRDELGRLGDRSAPGELTAAERRVAELAASGLANKEIAGALFVSVHTVEAHLSRAYAKLGVRSRSQLAGRLS
jgi:DNA-binding CsgD family transcriptional regulator